MNIPVFKPYFSKEEEEASVAAIKLGWLGPGSYVREFEARLAAFLGVAEELVVAVNTGTSAVHLALELCGVGHGDEVITPSFNNIADFQMIRALGAKPVFCDILDDTLTIDPAATESLISDKTKAIICLDYGCALCDYQAVKEIGDRHGIPVIHDAAHAFGSSAGGHKVGAQSEICTFSFDPVKNITCIDGGAVVVKTTAQAQKVRYMRLLGQQQDQKNLYQNKRAWTYDVGGAGYRYHLANLHGAIGIEQMKKIDDIYRERQRVFHSYDRALRDINGLKLPVMNGEEIMPFIYIVRVLQGRRQEFIQYMADHGVDTGIHWQPGHGFSVFADCRRGPLPVTEAIGQQIVTLPTYPGLSDQEIAHIVDVVRGFFADKMAA